VIYRLKLGRQGAEGKFVVPHKSEKKVMDLTKESREQGGKEEALKNSEETKHPIRKASMRTQSEGRKGKKGRTLLVDGGRDRSNAREECLVRKGASKGRSPYSPESPVRHGTNLRITSGESCSQRWPRQQTRQKKGPQGGASGKHKEEKKWDD